jgi:transcriptional regulator with XRE-family HTH domain
MKNRSRHANLQSFVDAWVAKGRTEGSLAERLKIAPNTLSQYKHGARIPEPDIALRIHKFCKVPLEKLLTRRAA